MVKDNRLRFKTQADCISVSGQMPHLIDYWIHYFACGVTLLAISVVYVEGLKGSYVGVTFDITHKYVKYALGPD